MPPGVGSEAPFGGSFTAREATSLAKKPKAEKATAKYARAEQSRVPASHCRLHESRARRVQCRGNPPRLLMLQSTPDEKQTIIGDVNWQALDQTVKFLQQAIRKQR